MLKEIKIKTRLLIGFSVLTLLVILNSVVGYTGIKRVSKAGNAILDKHVPIADYSMELAIKLITTRDLLAEYLGRTKGLDKIEGEFHEVMGELHREYAMKDKLALDREEKEMMALFGAKMVEYEKSAKEMLRAHKETVHYRKEAGELMEKMDAKVGPVLERAKAAKFTLDEFQKINEFVMVVNDYIITESEDELAHFKKLGPEIRELSKFPAIASEYGIVYPLAKQTVEAVTRHIKFRRLAFERMESIDKISSQMEETVRKLEQKAGFNMAKAIKSARETQSSSTGQQIVLALVSICLALFLGIAISRSITNPIQNIVDLIRDIAQGEGDLTKRIHIDSKDELGELAVWFNRFVDNIHNIVLQVKESTLTVTAASQEIAAGNQDLSQRSQQQASALEETASTVEQMTANIKANADNSQGANKISQEAVKAARAGEKVVKKTVISMEEVNNSSRKISEIITVVNDIAFQTNLLALNAAVEAARAGEQGRGFAVVAGEVRILAGRAAEAAKEIRHLIDESVSKVRAGNQLVEETGKNLNEIINHINQVAEKILEISSATQEQSSGIDQVNLAITQIDEAVQQNASLVEEAAATSENLSAEAGRLEQMMSRFKVNSQSGRVNQGNQERSKGKESTKEISAIERKKLLKKVDNSGFEEF